MTDNERLLYIIESKGNCGIYNCDSCPLIISCLEDDTYIENSCDIDEITLKLAVQLAVKRELISEEEAFEILL